MAGSRDVGRGICRAKFSREAKLFRSPGESRDPCASIPEPEFDERVPAFAGTAISFCPDPEVGGHRARRSVDAKSRSRRRIVAPLRAAIACCVIFSPLMAI